MHVRCPGSASLRSACSVGVLQEQKNAVAQLRAHLVARVGVGAPSPSACKAGVHVQEAAVRTIHGGWYQWRITRQLCCLSAWEGNAGGSGVADGPRGVAMGGAEARAAASGDRAPRLPSALSGLSRVSGSQRWSWRRRSACWRHDYLGAAPALQAAMGPAACRLWREVRLGMSLRAPAPPIQPACMGTAAAAGGGGSGGSPPARAQSHPDLKFEQASAL